MLIRSTFSVLVRKYNFVVYFLEGPFPPSRRLAIHGGALISNILVRVLATGTLGQSTLLEYA
ncbi:hypothetical protein [Desulfosporosinus sp. I2]|uniref:hypothetical protein n=1 Tax=Desulfosporosinus sp. I2 TaxID=1617025 RepID=UPI0012E01C61|nr:hypothetical protein [Desulfosporosinus sp. I2]